MRVRVRVRRRVRVRVRVRVWASVRVSGAEERRVGRGSVTNTA